MTLLRQGSRYIAIGAICVMLNIVIMLALDLLHFHYAVSSAISFMIVVAAGYALHVRITFQERPRVRSLLRYAASMALNYPINLALLFVMCDLAALPVAIAVPVATVIMLCWNFAAGRWAMVERSNPAGPTVR